MISLASPRAPAAPLGAALYESHYLTAADPAGGRALWLRFTALKRPGEPASHRLADLLRAPSVNTITWDYASPRGPGRSVDNCSVADAQIALETTGGTRSLTVSGAAAVEHGSPSAT